MKYSDVETKRVVKDGQGKVLGKVMNPIWSSFAFMLILILFFCAKDFFKDMFTRASQYEIRYEQEDTMNNGQKLYRLYINGEYAEDVDYNTYSLLDEDGNMDIKFCHMVNSGKRLFNAILLGVMILIGLKIAKSSVEGTPFTKENVKRICTIACLQLVVAFVPGFLAFVMKAFRFSYAHGTFDIEGLYMFVIAFVIAMIAHVFNYGVKLQEDSDSIL